MSDKTPSKAEALRAMREANYSAKSSEVGKPAPRMSTPSAVRGKTIGANDMPSPETSGASESKPKKKRAPAGSFDRKAYQRELMRKRRAQE